MISGTEPTNSARVGLVQSFAFFGSKPKPNQPVLIQVGSDRVSGLTIKKGNWRKKGKSEEKKGMKYNK